MGSTVGVTTWGKLYSGIADQNTSSFTCGMELIITSIVVRVPPILVLSLTSAMAMGAIKVRMMMMVVMMSVVVVVVAKLVDGAGR